MRVTLYGRANSVNVQKALWLLDELGAHYELMNAGGPYGFPEGFEKISPRGLIPAVMVDGVAACESNTILRLLARRSGATALYPDQPGRREDVEAWMDWQLMALGLPMRRIFRKTVRGDGAYSEADLQELNAAMGDVAAALEGGGNLTGAALTLADIAVAPFAHRWLELPIDKPELPALGAWRERLRERPGFARHVDQPMS